MTRDEGLTEQLRQVITLAAQAIRAALLLVLVILSGLLRLIITALDAVRSAAGAIVRLMCAAAAVAGLAWSFMPIWSAFGGDVPALLPTVAILLTPIAFVIDAGGGWGGLVLAGLATFGAGIALPALPDTWRALIVVGVISAVVFHSLSKNDGENKHEAHTE